MKQRVVITGMAVISSLSNNLHEFWENIKEGRSGIRHISNFDTSGLPCNCAGSINPANVSELPGRISKYLTINTKIVASSCLSALQDADYDFEHNKSTPPGMIMGSFLGNIEKVVTWHKKYANSGYKGITPMDGFDVWHNAGMDYTGILINAKGIHNMISTGAASGLDAIGGAFHYIRSGRAKIVLTGGHENLFRDLLYIFASGGLLAGSTGKTGEIIKPLDKNRLGMVLGEGSAVLILEDLKHARKRNAKIYAEIAGFGSGFMNMKSKKKTGHAIVSALEDADLQPDDIDFINAAANGSIYTDKIEADSIQKVFRSAKNLPAISSIKGAVGECYGASGAMQCISTVFSINENIVPPTLNCINPITKIAPCVVTGQKKERKIKTAMINAIDCFGFNSSLIIGKFDRDFSD